MKKNLFTFSVLSLMMTIFLSCQESLVTDPVDLNHAGQELVLKCGIYNENGDYSEAEYCGFKIMPLFAGRTNEVGAVEVFIDEANLDVTYKLSDDVTGNLGMLHLWIGKDQSLVPVNPQFIPVPGQFPYSFDATGLRAYTFIIPLSDILGNCEDWFYVYTHAEVTLDSDDDGLLEDETEHETAWSGYRSKNIEEQEGGRWYYWDGYTIACCDNSEDLSVTSETAFAKGGYVFASDIKANPEGLPSLQLSKNRWGWAINITGQGTFTYDIWAAAGQNKTSKGIKTGAATVTWDGENVTVTCSMINPYSITEAHIYAGDLKPITIAPGQFGWINYFNPPAASFSEPAIFSVTDTDGDGLWLIIHNVVLLPAI